MSAQDNVKTIQQLYEAFGRGDIPTILNALADDVEWKEPPNGAPPFAGTHHGRDGVGRFFQRLAETVEPEQFEPREFVAQGDVVVALGYYRFRARTTGKSYDTEWSMVWRFRDGKVAQFQIYKDSAAEVAALLSS